MRTDDLVDLLSTGIAPVKGGVPARRFGIALLLAATGATLLMIALLGIRPDLAVVARTALFWEKLAFPLCVAIGAGISAIRLARPGARVGSGWPVMAAPVLLVWIAGIAVVAAALPQDRLPAVLGQSWRVCPFNILLLSLPGFAAIMWAVRGLAPTRPRLAGAVCGLLASSISTVAYCFHCPEMSPAFWSVWYLLGMLIPASIGALIGARILRW
ncbi:DUF1109 domain-containing protein [Burkholderia singularis]|uniref:EXTRACYTOPLASMIC FUNCTION ALTERNATIVE SIGMA FACTOR n=1 Tax=Burkholderia singularis TaxID=1503053 RepID=A0A238H8S5_9BURK|nr:DUF1109 domain-containing protein [Burkholderia singularis]SMG01739.1 EXTRACYTOPLASMIC FUNCTION ALTERNATIVE SIGMA FACTOR [Burkholderia singularis]